MVTEVMTTRNVIFALAGILWAAPLSAQPQTTNVALKNLKPATIAFGYTREPGTVEIVEVAIGDVVKAGQILLRLDHFRQFHAWKTAKLKSESEATLDMARGELRQKEAILNDVQTRYRRRQVSEASVQSAEGELETARGKLAQAKLNKELSKLDLELAENVLNMRFVFSPINGTVLEIARRPGEKASAGDAVVTVADLTSVQAEIPLIKDSVKGLGIGDSLPVRVPGSNTIRVAQVAAISPLAKAKNGEQLVRIIFPNLAPGENLAGQSYELLLPHGAKLAQVVPEKAPAPKAPAHTPAKGKGG